MLQLFPAVPTKTEISQAATSTRETQCKQRHQDLNLLPKKNQNLNFSFPFTLLLVLDLKKKKTDVHRLSADTQAVCHL